jgi:hypothetical protein
MSEAIQTSSTQRKSSWQGKAAFFVALALTLSLLLMGLTGIPWPRWLLALTNVL